MKKVIRGRLYDTEKAVLVGEFYDEAMPEEDLSFYREELYRKRTGEYFLYGIGNAGSKYSVWRGSTASGTEKIIPFSYQQAKEWAEENLPRAVYENEFGIPERNDDKTIMSFNLKIGNIEKLKVISAKQDKPMSSIIDELIENANCV